MNRLAIIGKNAIGLSNYKCAKAKLFDLMYSKLIGLEIKYSIQNSVNWGLGSKFDRY